MIKIHFLSFVILLCFNLEFCTIEAQKCGKGKSKISATIDGDGNAKKAEFPWSVAFVNREEEKFFCGGTLISAKHVLSAAHCFQNKNIREPLSPNLVEALLGKFNLSNKHEIGSKTLLVSKIVIHPDWKFDHEKFDADLSVVVLGRKVTFSDFIQPICLPAQSDDLVTGTGTVVGWGKSETSGDAAAIVPSMLEVPAVNDSMCYTTFHQLARFSSPRMFCGGYADLRKAPCLGDSGGGFYLRNEKESWEIRGIVSVCDLSKFALFTHIAKFTDWIEETMIETITVDWNFIEFKCVDDYSSSSWTTCSATFDGPLTRNSKIHADFSLHGTINSSIDVTGLSIDFSPSTYILSGIGEEFPNLSQLRVKGDSIKFIERQNFYNLTQLDVLSIFRTSIDFLPEDLLAELSNLTWLEIRFCDQLERLPEKLFMNQKKLIDLNLNENGLTVLQRDLFKNNLKLETLVLTENKLIEIYVDFTRWQHIKFIGLRGNKCIDQNWILEDGSSQSFQEKINRNCSSPRGV